MTNDNDGFGGTDNVRPLFANSPTAAGLPPQDPVIEALESALVEARSGRMSGVLLIGFTAGGDTMPITAGKIVYSSMITELETLKIKAILLQDPFLYGGKK